MKKLAITALLATLYTLPVYAELQGKTSTTTQQSTSASKNTGSNPLKNLRATHDKMEGLTFYQHKSSPQYRNANGAYLYFSKEDTKGTITPIRLSIQYYGDDWLFLESAWAKADGTRITLATGKWDRDNDSKVWEWADHEVPASFYPDIKKMAFAKDVVIRLEGKKYYQDLKLTQAQLKAMQEVLTAYEAAGGPTKNY